MGFSYYVRIASYVEIPRNAVPGANINDKPLYLILREHGLECYPGHAGNYADESIKDGIKYEMDGTPCVDLRRIWLAWDSDEEQEYPRWADHERFSKDWAIVVEIDVQESYKGGDMISTGNYHSMISELQAHNIDITNVECGWQYTLYNDM